jgi:hypothetical protein
MNWREEQGQARKAMEKYGKNIHKLFLTWLQVPGSE